MRQLKSGHKGLGIGEANYPIEKTENISMGHTPFLLKVPQHSVLKLSISIQ